MKNIKSLPTIFYLGLLLFGIINILEQCNIVHPAFEFLKGASSGFIICGAFLTILTKHSNWLQNFKHTKKHIFLK